MRCVYLLLSERADGLCWALLLNLLPTQTHDSNLISYEVSRVLNCLLTAVQATNKKAASCTKIPCHFAERTVFYFFFFQKNPFKVSLTQGKATVSVTKQASQLVLRKKPSFSPSQFYDMVTQALEGHTWQLKGK